MSKKKELSTLIEDIYSMLDGVIDGKSVELNDEVFAEFGANVAMKLKNTLTARTSKSRKTKTLYMSEYGRPCKRQLWYDIRDEHKVNKEKLSAPNLIKFLYGDILEEVVLVLSEAAGHEVSDAQKECEVNLPRGWRLRGRMDAKIDGEIVDVKSTTSYGFKKFAEGTLAKDDPFGYIPQLAAYNDAEYDGEMPYGTKTAFVVIDKQLGHMCAMELESESSNTKESVEQTREELVSALESPVPPDRAFVDVPEGKSGNMKLATGCSYCGFKHECWKDSNDGKGLRTFVYSKGPVFLTNVAKEPKVGEVKE